jgi:hypothetical protein
MGLHGLLTGIALPFFITSPFRIVDTRPVVLATLVAIWPAFLLLGLDNPEIDHDLVFLTFLKILHA